MAVKNQAKSAGAGEFIRSLPKAELHLHLEGSVEPETLAELSHRHKTPLRAKNSSYVPGPNSGRALSLQEATAVYDYGNFRDFLMAFKTVTECLRDPEDFELITYRLVQRLAAENVVHAEVYISVGVYLWRGDDFDALFEGMERGRQRGERDFGVSLLWLFDAVRQFGPTAAEAVVEKAIHFRAQNVAGFGIGGDERAAPPDRFAEVYSRARQHGLRLTAHAGESAGPDSVRGALEVLGADRIGHALTAAQDAQLLACLVQRQVPLEICLTSNRCTGCCPNVEEHPLRKYFDAGALVILNTDDPAMFHTSLTQEYLLARDIFAFTFAELRQLAANSFRASFLEESRKRSYLRLLDAVAVP